MAHKMDLFALQEMVMASAVPNPIPTFAASVERFFVSVVTRR